MELEIFQNKHTGKFFIYVDDHGGAGGKDNVILVTPDNSVLSLQRDKFHESKEGDSHKFLSHGFITELQVETYEKELSRRETAKEIEKRQAYEEAWEKMTKGQIDEKVKAFIDKLSPSEHKELQDLMDHGPKKPT